MSTIETRQQQARFWRKFMRLTRGRIDAFRAFEVIIAEERDAPFKDVLTEILSALKSGATIGDAFRRHPETFSLSVLELVSAAESSGAWDEVIEEIAAGLEEGTFD